jgi:hypothetical protein
MLYRVTPASSVTRSLSLAMTCFGDYALALLRSELRGFSLLRYYQIPHQCRVERRRSHPRDEKNSAASPFFSVETSWPSFTFTEGLRRMMERLMRLLDPKARRKCENEALAIAATMVGGMILARAVDDRELSDRILAACRARLNQRRESLFISNEFIASFAPARMKKIGADRSGNL